MLYIDGRPAEEKPLIEPTLPSLFSDWTDGIFDITHWGYTTEGNDIGSVGIGYDDIRGSRICVLNSGAVNGGMAGIYGQSEWQRRSSNLQPAPEISGYDHTAALYYLVMDWEARLDSVPVINNDAFIMGFIRSLDFLRSDFDRQTREVCGFILQDDALYTLTDTIGAESVIEVPGTPDLDDHLYHYRIMCLHEKIIFMHNHQVVTVHTNNMDNAPVYPIFVIQNDQDDTCQLDITNISIGYRRYPSQILV